MKQITIFGGSGFLGRYLVRRLISENYRVRIAVRHPNQGLYLKPIGELGQIDLFQSNVRFVESVKRALEGSVAAVNLVGLLFEGGKQRFIPVHAKAPGTIAEIARKEGLKALVHVSAIGADRDSASKYAQSKAAGEEAVRKHFPRAVIIRPSLLIGPEDDFFNRFAELARLLPVVPLVGGATRFQPVYVDDVARAITSALNIVPHASESIFELGGPKIYSFRELLDLMMDVTGQRKRLINIPFWLAKFQAAFLQMLPTPPLTIDQVRLLQSDNIVSGDKPGFEKLGIAPMPIECVLPDYLGRFRKRKKS